MMKNKLEQQLDWLEKETPRYGGTFPSRTAIETASVSRPPNVSSAVKATEYDPASPFTGDEPPA